MLPLLFDVLVTVTGSWQKIFSSDPKVGYWANHGAFKDALAQGKTSFGTAKNVEAMEAVVRNTFVQGTLSVLFVVLTIVVVVMGVVETVKALRGRGRGTHEDPVVESRFYAPSGLVAMPSEKALEKQWRALPLEQRTPTGGGHH